MTSVRRGAEAEDTLPPLDCTVPAAAEDPSGRGALWLQPAWAAVNVSASEPSAGQREINRFDIDSSERVMCEIAPVQARKRIDDLMANGEPFNATV